MLRRSSSHCFCAFLFAMPFAMLRPASHVLFRFIRASLAMNLNSFVDRFTAIQCAAGSAFEAVDLNIESRNDELIWEMTSVSASQSQDAPSENHVNGPYKCHNCRSVAASPTCVRMKTQSLILACWFFSHTVRLDSVLNVRLIFMTLNTQALISPADLRSRFCC